MKDLSKLSSSITTIPQTTSTYTNITIRGISSADYYNPSMTLYVDEVPQSFTSYNQGLYDVANVQILKGPQGTIYGSGAQGGVINITTKNPLTHGDYAEGSVSASGLYYNAAVNAGGALYQNSVFAKIGARYTHEIGFIENQNGDKINENDAYGGNLALIYSLGDKIPLIATLGGAWSQENGHKAGVWLRENEYRNKKLESTSMLPNLVSPQEKRDNASGYFKLEYLGNLITLHSITTYAVAKNCDAYMPLQTSCDSLPTDTSQITQEFRITNEFQNGIKAIGGLYGSKLTTDTASNSPLGGNFDSSVDDNNLAVFGNMIVPFGRVDVEGGLRYSYANASADYQNRLDSTQNYNGVSKDHHDIDYKVALGYKIAPTHRVYILHSTATKAGGFNRFPRGFIDAQGYDPEKTYNYELGYHTHLTQNLNLNTALFYMNIKDRQAYYDDASNHLMQRIQNIGTLNSKGIELDMAYEGSILSAYASFTYADSEYGDEKPLYANKTPGNAPKFVGNALVEVLVYQGNGIRGYIGGSGRYTSKLYFDEYESMSQKAYALIDAFLRVEYQRLSVSLFAQNLTNTRYATYIMDMRDFEAYLPGYGDIYYNRGEPLNIGLMARYRF